ncbi:unnamed protein product [Rhodiola kirilowii]
MDSPDHDHGQDNSREPAKDITSYDLGIGRSYECVFCKRGFTTAQALGGHMNIHRKDRARPKLNPSPSSSLNHESNNPVFPSTENARNTTPYYDRQLSSKVDYHQFLIPNSSSSSNPRFIMDASQNGLLSTCCKENWCSVGLGLQIGVPSPHDVDEIGRRRSSQGGFIIHHQAAEELDLELRLGHLKP